MARIGVVHVPCYCLRYRVDLPIRVEGPLRPIRPDVVFTRKHLAIFIDGCWWHGCTEHSTTAKTNAGYWREKIAENRARDARMTQALGDGGWQVIRVWEHEPVPVVVARVVTALGM